MSRVHFLADPHFGHRNILKYRTQFKSIAEHDNYIVERWNNAIGKNDTVYLLGDAAFTMESLEIIRSLRGQKILIRGNHDTLNAAYYLWVFKDVLGSISYKNTWLSHIPIHPSEMRRKILNIHGHTHHKIIDDPMYFSVCCEQIDYRPIAWSEILKRTDNEV
ncbi:MAG: hypothetical protein HN932_13045 [Candidatus Marinimicrobia bacterium]|jgi:calcineurin-like phosphoesterase family protein|nr:hypothetical protein [Candidatus Neomarinimicrobiota bacterium]MBT7339080.1 hypothetical protein [Candidatus Jacksonbacteria bacterium]